MLEEPEKSGSFLLYNILVNWLILFSGFNAVYL